MIISKRVNRATGSTEAVFREIFVLDKGGWHVKVRRQIYRSNILITQNI